MVIIRQGCDAGAHGMADTCFNQDIWQLCIGTEYRDVILIIFKFQVVDPVLLYLNRDNAYFPAIQGPDQQTASLAVAADDIKGLTQSFNFLGEPGCGDSDT